MRVMSKRKIREFARVHAGSFEPLEYWYRIARKAAWSNLAEVRSDLPHADVVGRFTVFNIGGNKYRMITTIKYRWKVVYLRHILTHADYEKGARKL